jgi:4-hydroxybenzoate polyprenyltransferase
MLAPISVWIALRGQWVWQQPGDLLPAGLLGLAVLLWVSGFDIIYACQDAGFRCAGPVAKYSGGAGRGRCSAFGRLLSCGDGGGVNRVALVGGQLGARVGFTVSEPVAVAVLLVTEHLMVRPDDLSRVNAAFFHANWMLSVGLLVITSVDLLT